MWYPNGSYRLDQLIRDFKSGDFDFYLEKNEEPPKDWNISKGFYRGPRTPIKTIEELKDAVLKDMGTEYTICIDTRPSYHEKHPFEGEEKSYVREVFKWEYASPYGKKYCYAIRDCAYLPGYEPKYKPFSLDCYEDGFKGTCFTIGSWERDKEGYEFHSCGNRLFNYIEPEDLERIFNAVKAADEYLNERFHNEEDD